MKNVVDLLNLYSEINTKVINNGKNTSHCFRYFTDLLIDIVKVLKLLNVVLETRELEIL